MAEPRIPLLPCTSDAQGGAAHVEAPAVLSERAPLTIAYDGIALTLQAFLTHVQRYDFGPVAPSQIVLHNTANPAASWAPAANTPNWDRDEDGLSDIQIKAKRLRQLDAIYYGYYRDGLKWSAGPHLFVDDRFVYLGTPMDTIGIHAGAGNSYRVGGKLRYSIGIEIVGRYALVRWPEAIITQLRGVVQALSKRLPIQIAYTAAPDDVPTRHDGQLSFHRDYSTKDCPGSAIDPAWAVQVLSATPPPKPTPPAVVMYVATHTQAIFESPAPDGKIALNGQAELGAGTSIGIDEIKNGWAHLANHVGFVPVGILERI